jgi:AcrR family transcriptional regulator
MTRIAKDPAERRIELIACAQKLFYSRGYETTSVSDIVDELGVAKGTFYYYFDSKLAILEAMVESAIGQSMALVHDIAVDPALPALEKWVRALGMVGAWKTARKEEMLALLHLLQKDENVLLQHKVRTHLVRMMAPEFARIIDQGIEEGVFETEFADDSAEIALSIMLAFSETIAHILLNPEDHDEPAALATRKLAAIQDALERVLGAPRGSLPLADEKTFAAWF